MCSPSIIAHVAANLSPADISAGGPMGQPERPDASSFEKHWLTHDSSDRTLLAYRSPIRSFALTIPVWRRLDQNLPDVEIVGTDT